MPSLKTSGSFTKPPAKQAQGTLKSVPNVPRRHTRTSAQASTDRRRERERAFQIVQFCEITFQAMAVKICIYKTNTIKFKQFAEFVIKKKLIPSICLPSHFK